jgi:hypothetical protein
MCHSLNNYYYNSKYPIFSLNKVDNLKYKEEEFNNFCFDCGKMNPELISINNGIFICKKCGMDHMLFPGGASILIKNDISSLSDKEIKLLQYGGNKKLYDFIYNQCPTLMNLPKRFLYTSPLLNFYQNKLEESANKVNRVQSNKNFVPNKLCNLRINSNYSVKEIINNSLKKYHKDFFNSEILNENNDTEFNNTIKYKLDDDNAKSPIFNQKTNNTNANTISYSNTLTYISERTNDNYNFHTKKSIDSKNRIGLNINKIIYNKPKISNGINILKNEKYKHDINNKNFKYNTFINNTIDNTTDNNYYSNNTIDFKKLSYNILLKGYETHQKYNNTEFYFRTKNDNDNNITNKKMFSTIDSNFYDYKNENFGQNTINRYNSNNSMTRRNKSERKIREIIIKKNMNILRNNRDNLITLSNNPRKPITVNLKINNPMEHSLNDKFMSNKYRNDFDVKEIRNYNDKSNTNNKRTIEINNRYRTTNRKIFDYMNKYSKNIKNYNGKILKKNNIFKIINNKNNINISINKKSKNGRIFRNLNRENIDSKINIKVNKTFESKKSLNNFLINKNKLDLKEMKKIYIKNPLNNPRERSIKKNGSSIITTINNSLFFRDNVDQFQILPNLILKKNENNKSENNVKNGRSNSIKYKTKSKNINNYKEVLNGETFKYSIMNKYKKEKAIQN